MPLRANTPKSALTARPDENYFGERMAAAQKGDGTAYGELLETLHPLLSAYAGRGLARMGRRDSGRVDDLVQEVLLALHEKRHTYDPRQPFLPWLFSIARYKLIDFGRREKHRSSGIPWEAVEASLEAPVFAEAGAQADLEALLRTLPEKPRRALELVKLQGLTAAEAAAATQMSVSAVKVAIHRAIQTLKKSVGGGTK